MRSTGREHVALDVREASELDIYQLEGALHIPMAEIPARVNDLPTNLRLAVTRHYGARSQMVSTFSETPALAMPSTSTAASKRACEIDRSMRRYR
jgi:hypothetical protein